MYRPWGQLEWVLSHGPSPKWDLIGAIAPEDRCLTVWTELSHRADLVNQKLLLVKDVDSNYRKEIDICNERHLTTLRALTGTTEAVEEHSLIEPYGLVIESTERFLHSSNGNVVLDISCLPKRFFYPMLRILLKSDRVKNLLITYSVPETYFPGKLAERTDDWAALPTFAGGTYTSEPSSRLVINVGFMSMGLDEQVADQEWEKIYLLFPFPANPQFVHRSWAFVRRLETQRNAADFRLIHTDPRDVSSAFERLISIGDGPRITLAPFGPKTTSVAMCLYAMLTDTEVYYTQPTVYRPDYSTGVARFRGRPSIYAYWLRINGRDLYKL